MQKYLESNMERSAHGERGEDGGLGDGAKGYADLDAQRLPNNERTEVRAHAEDELRSLASDYEEQGNQRYAKWLRERAEGDGDRAVDQYDLEEIERDEQAYWESERQELEEAVSYIAALHEKVRTENAPQYVPLWRFEGDRADSGFQRKVDELLEAVGANHKEMRTKEETTRWYAGDAPPKRGNQVTHVYVYQTNLGPTLTEVCSRDPEAHGGERVRFLAVEDPPSQTEA
jgi:hypothetical protein